MDSEDGPNFSYAYGGTSAAPASSWNPALRPDHEKGPVAKESPDSALSADAESGSEVQIPQAVEDEEEELPTAPAIPSHVHNSVFEDKSTLNSDDDFFDRYGAPDVDSTAPQWETERTNGHPVLEVEETAAPTKLGRVQDVERIVGDGNGDTHDTQIPAQQEWPEVDAEDAGLLEEHPADNYEHQGESTLLEEAVTESAKAPLVADADLPTDDWGSSGEVFDVGGVAQEAPLPTPHVDAVGTNIGDEVIGQTNVGGSAGEDHDWGTGDDQDFFGVNTQQPTTESKPTTHSAWDIALDDDFLPDNDENAAPPFELDDDEGFLEDEPHADGGIPPTQPASSANKYAPQVAHTPQTAPNAYGLQGNQSADPSQKDRTQPIAATTAAYGVYNQPLPYQQPTRPTLSSSSQSFADKAKGGYASPYDLPADIAPVKKRPANRPSTGPVSQTAPPPPRTSSMSAGAGVSRPPPPSNMSTASLSPPSSSHSMQSPMTGLPTGRPAPTQTSASDFFAELPITSKPKPSGRYTPQQQSVPHTPQGPPINFAPPQLPPKERTSSWSSLRNEVLPDSASLISQLQQPDRLPAFPDQPSNLTRTTSLPVPQTAPPPAQPRYSPAPPNAIPTANARYSPAPPTGPAANTRYSPTPPSQTAPAPSHAPAHARYVSEPPLGPPRPPVQPFAPRTSSPLAFHTIPQDQQEQPVSNDQAVHQAPSHHAMHSADGIPRAPLRRPLEGVNEVEELEQTTGIPTTTRSQTPPLRSGPSSTAGSPRKRSNYVPQYQSMASSGVPPPARSQSQSPGATKKRSLYSVSSLERPASAGFGAQHSTPPAANIIPHKRQMSRDFQFIRPTDERVHDPLERWKGYPIFHWGLGGTVVTSFPNQIPRYGGGASVPMLKCNPGEIKVQSVKDLFPLSEEISKFPGPLKSKGKKKDVLIWLGKRIEAFEASLQAPGLDQSVSPEDLKRLEEKVMLWKIMQVLVDNDGHLEGSNTAKSAVSKVLSPDGADAAIGEDTSFATGADLVGITRSNTSALQAEPVDPKAVEELRTLLTKGDREKAVWHAVDQRLWAHAMLLSSTLNKDVWKQVVQEFVRKEVKKVGRNNQALAVLYEIFAGNWEDCIDELVPASARAGFQMVGTDGAGSGENALQGLDKWRETLSLILNNRSEGDVAALLSLGRLLAGYGRVEAAHICFIFARSVAHVGGVDDPQTDIVLVGADHRSRPADLGSDLEHILLTEVYEFALSLSAPSGTHVLPHLQTYKLVHAYTLAEYGQRTDAQAYCDSIAYAMKATTKISAYYNGSFIASLDDLSKRLSQSPKDGSSSWISKPSMDKVSSSLLSKFNSFIAGDDDDVASNHSGANDVGPFAKIAGNSPNLTPSQSNVDLYGAYAGYGGPAPVPAASVNSRYAPTNSYTPRGSIDQGQSRYEPQGRPSMESTASSFSGRQASDNYLPSPQFSGPYTPNQPHFSPPAQRMQAPKTHTYSPLKSESPAVPPSYSTPYQPTPPAEEITPSYGSYDSHQPSFDTQPPSPPSDELQAAREYEPPSLGYQPPTSSYEPPSYQPYNPDEDQLTGEDEKPKKKKSFMDDDDDDDIVARAAALKNQHKSEADRKADDAFRKAAEADAQRDKDAKKAGGWFGGWFKKDPNAAPGPIKAKLGEENSFYYDPELKKWVNKKAGPAEASKPIATPPPPKSGPPSRIVSGNSVVANHALGFSNLGTSLPPSGPPTRPPTSQPPRSSSMPPPISRPHSRASTPGVPSDSEGSAPPLMPPASLGASGPPSRPGTGMSNASSIDDLLGAPAAKKGGTVKKGRKGGRYIDVMAQK